MNQIPISVFIITLNEAKYLQRVLEPLSVFDEVVVVDSGSHDGTLEIAEKAGARVIHQDWLGFAKQKQFAMQQCQNEWVLNLDGDEVVSKEFVESLQALVDNQKYDAIRLYFEDIFWGAKMSPYSAKRSIVRCFKRSEAQYPMDRLVHENIVLPKGSRIKNLGILVTHFGYSSTQILMNKQNKYSFLKAQEKYNKGKSGSLLKLAMVFPFTFVKCYIFKKMFLSGQRGLVHATIEAQYAFLKEAKLMELKLTANDIEISPQDKNGC